MSLSFFFIKLTSYAIYYWYPTYLMQDKNYSKSEALDTFQLFNSGSTVGIFVMGVVSDLVSLRSPVFESGILCSTLLFFLIAQSS